ncbi:uncharacterized protein LOC123518571 [Portunus trituberculatus]|uniref:uncharacterized protein LOC123518571 n=1 Tax=Portunus trituberculatus TaxID=210409 RepID=UPI001E1CDD6E|nr:uncharacterized protein LOC123518571 [Portunus trituberculatus]
MQNTAIHCVSQQQGRHYACQEDVGCSYHYIFYNTFRMHFPTPQRRSHSLCWEHKDNLAADHEHEARNEQTKEALRRFFKENASTDEQAISPSDTKRQMLLYLIKREAAKKRNKKTRETSHLHDPMEKDLINIFQFKDLNEVPHAAQTQGLFKLSPQSPQQFLTLFKDLQKASLKDITAVDKATSFSTILKKLTKDQRIKDILPPPGLREYPLTQYSQSQLQSIPTLRCRKLEIAWIAKINALFMSQETPSQTSQRDDECLQDWKVLASHWESLYRKYFFMGLHHQPKKQEGSLWPYFPWVSTSQAYDHCISEFGNSNIPTRCSKSYHPAIFSL